MTEFTIDMLREITRGGPDEDADTDYTALDYDSLAVLEIQSQIENALGVTLPDGAIVTTMTPRQTVALVNDHLRKREVSS
ncbi:acyl carrier protein [Streptomyces sp. NPDC086554]|uniref:acyl carrier protein n=1 Tax=unclassified Streptomyces TaxID=2593676 RepID=UPI00340CF6BB